MWNRGDPIEDGCTVQSLKQELLEGPLEPAGGLHLEALLEVLEDPGVELLDGGDAPKCGVTGGRYLLDNAFFWNFYFLRRRHPLWPCHWRCLWLHLRDNRRLLNDQILYIYIAALENFTSPSLLNWGEHKVLRAQPVHEEGHQGWKHGRMCFPLLWGQQVQVLDLQPKVGKVFDHFTKYFITECQSVGWRLQTRERVHPQRGQCQDKNHVEFQVI